MIISFFIAGLAGLGSGPAAPALDEPSPIKLWINGDRSFKPGESVKVQVETERAGYLLVLHMAPDGRVSVLFPLSPDDDASVLAGRRYEIRDQHGVESFIAAGPGQGLVYSALAEDPWRFESVRSGSAWDYGAITIPRDTRNPEADLTTLVQRLASDRGYDYDLLDYVVLGANADQVPASYAYDDGYYGGSTVYLSFGFGWPYWSYGYWPWYSCCGYYYGFGHPWYWGYSHYPYYPYYGGHYYGYPYKQVVGRARGYTIQPYGRYGNGGSRGYRPGGSGWNGQGTGTNGAGAVPHGPARRARGGSIAGRPSGGDGGNAAAPNGGRSSTGSQSSRPRENGGRARGGRNTSQIEAVTPQIERARPASRARGGDWVRMPEAPEAARVGGRRVASGTTTPIYVERTRGAGRERIDVVTRSGGARPVYTERARPGAATRSETRLESGGRGLPVARRATPAAGQMFGDRTVARARGGPVGGSGGARAFNPPAARGGAGQTVAPRASAPAARGFSGGGGSRSSGAMSGGRGGGGGGGGRSRGGRP